MSSKKYTGHKNIEGLYQKIINQIPAFSRFIELFAGSAQITRLINFDFKPVILIDIDSKQTQLLQQEWDNDFFRDKRQLPHPVEIINFDAIQYLKNINNDVNYKRCGKGDFYFIDNPYHHSTRPNNKEIYTHEMTHEQHVQFLQECLQLNCMCLIIHPVCDLYDTMLKDWHKVYVKVRYHRKTSIECLYMNYPEPTNLQDYRYIGKNCWDRQRITKRKKAYLDKFKKMPVLERKAILKELNEL